MDQYEPVVQQHSSTIESTTRNDTPRSREGSPLLINQRHSVQSSRISASYSFEGRSELENHAFNSSEPAFEVHVYTRLNDADIELSNSMHHSSRGVPLTASEISIDTSMRSSSTATEILTHQSVASKSREPYPSILHRRTHQWKQRYQRLSRGWGQHWTTEICTYVLSIVALAGLVTTLLVHQSKPLPQWPQLVTINSIISLFSLVMRACVGAVLAEGLSQCKWNWYRRPRRLDHIERLYSASRGSWGSLTLLLHSRPSRIYYLAALGAVITIQASLTGFFSQQLVQFEDCAQKSEALATISRTNSYTQAGAPIMSNMYADYAPMISAINVSLLRSNGDLTSVLSSGCSSGSCTFPDTDGASFSTLAVCHLCQDSTSRIRIFNESKPHEISPEDLLELKYGHNKTKQWARNTPGVVVQTWTDNEQPGITGIYFLFRQHWNNMTWAAVNCTLLPTINTYLAGVEDAILKETLVNRTYLPFLREQFDEPAINDRDFNNYGFTYTHRAVSEYTLRNGTRASCEGSVAHSPGLAMALKSSSDPTYRNLTGHTNPSAGWKWWYYPEDCVWTIRKNSIFAMRDTLDEVFKAQNVALGPNGGTMGSAHLRALFLDGAMDFDSINRDMGNLSTSMSTVFRTHGGLDDTSPVVLERTFGTVWVTTTCVYIRWKWITFPAVMIGLTGLFLVLVAIENRGTPADRLWKSSFLAALFCEVEVHEKVSGKEDMRVTARTTSVTLHKDSSRLRLVKD